MPQEKHIYAVSELTKNIKRVLELSFGQVWVEGEISNVRQPSSGHCYFTLKDEYSQVRCVLFRHQSPLLKCKLSDGMQVIILGRVSVYERDGSYQLYAELIEQKGKGNLQAAFEQLKAQLMREGLFDEARKKPLPFLPDTIGIVTSSTGAVIRDMLHVLEKRFDTFRVILYPVKVQGDGAGKEIAAAINYFNEQKNVDVIIVGRGGGSIEDLWAFNEETVARALFASAIPVVSAVGHEVDFTIADFVSDVRAPTPSRAAELVVPYKQELLDRIQSSADDLQRALSNYISQQQQRIDDLFELLEDHIEAIIKDTKSALEVQCSKLAMLSPLRTLSRGYSVTYRAGTNRLITDAKKIQKGQRIKTHLHKGYLVSIVKETHHEV